MYMHSLFKKFHMDVVVILFGPSFIYVLNFVATLVEEERIPKLFFKYVMLEFLM